LEFARAALPTFFTVLAIVYFTRLVAGRARFGVALDEIGRPGTVQHMTHSLFRVFRIAIWAACVMRAIEPDFDELLGIIPELMHPATVFIGLLLLVGGFAWVGYCHNYMGLEWRSGVPEKHVPGLITTGPFARMRHPMFAGVMFAQFGFFLALPSIFSLICFVLGAMAVLVQTHFEEAELSKRLGEAFEAYRAEVPAWLPRGFGGRERNPAE
jgi:protein-S-isoprenylcysteine O-methyltransferase Ste14